MCAAHATEEPAEDALDQSSRQRHPRRKRYEKRSEGDKLRDGSRTPEHAGRQPRLHLSHVLGQGGHGARGRCDLPPVIAVSRAAQVVNSEQRVKKIKTQRGSEVARDERLDVGGVHTGNRFERDRRQARDRQGKRAIGGSGSFAKPIEARRRNTREPSSAASSES